MTKLRAIVQPRPVMPARERRELDRQVTAARAELLRIRARESELARWADDGAAGIE